MIKITKQKLFEDMKINEKNRKVMQVINRVKNMLRKVVMNYTKR